jgi:hypothetical protein
VKIHLTRQGAIGPSAIIQRIEVALREQFKKSGTDDPLYWYPREVFDDSIIVYNDDEGKLYRITYSMDGETVTFGEPVGVEEEYVEIESGNSAEETNVRQSALMLIKQSLSPNNLKWRFQVVGWGLSQSRHIWRPDIFAQSLQQFEWENLDAYLDHPTKTEEAELPERSLEKKVGWWSDFEITPEGMDATLNLKPSAAWIGDDIQSAYEAGNKKFYAASILVAHKSKKVVWSDGKPATDPLIVKPGSIDLVTTAAADGHVKHALASNRGQQNSEGERSMNKSMLLRILAMLNTIQFATVRQSLVTAGAQGVTVASTAQEVVEAIHEDEALVTQAMTAVEEATKEVLVTARQSAGAELGVEGDEISFARMPLAFRRLAVQQAITGSDLPEAVQQAIRKKVTDATTLDGIEAVIETTRDSLAIVTQAGVFNNPRVEAGAARADKISVGLAKAFGLSRDEYNGIESSYQRYCRQSGGGLLGEIPQDDWNTVPKLLSIKNLYVDLTGDREMEGRGRHVQRITRQATWITSDFTELLSNVMHKRLLRDFRSLSPTWQRLVTVKDLIDLKTQYAVLVGEFGDLPAVAEQGDYLEPSALTDTKESYDPSKRGRVVSLSWETVVNDDLGGFLRTYGKLGRAAARTLLKFVWNTCFMANPTLAADSKTLFHVDHGNLITTALGTPGLKEAVTALLNQTEPGSNEKMDVDTMNLTLAVAPGEYLNAQTLTDFNNAGGGEQDALAQLVRRMGIKPVAVPFFTDANDWALIASPLDREIVEIGFYQGNQEPEFFTQNDPTQGDSFGKDTVAKYKIRHVYGGAPVDYRGAVKSVVAD